MFGVSGGEELLRRVPFFSARAAEERRRNAAGRVPLAISLGGVE